MRGDPTYEKQMLSMRVSLIYVFAYILITKKKSFLRVRTDIYKQLPSHHPVRRVI